MILDGEHRPGASWFKQQLAKSFGVAQGVVREALLELKACGLVETVDNRGIFVTDLSIQRFARCVLTCGEMNEGGWPARLCCESGHAAGRLAS